MNILIVEDDTIKKKMIEQQILAIRPEARIRWFSNLREAQYFIDRNYEYIDLLVLDWCFPESSIERPIDGTGRKMLDYIKDKKYNVKTVICSGEEMNMDELQEYYFLLGSVLFGTCNAGKAINSLYLDYWKNVSELTNKTLSFEPKSLEKKLVNSDVK